MTTSGILLLIPAAQCQVTSCMGQNSPDLSPPEYCVYYIKMKTFPQFSAVFAVIVLLLVKQCKDITCLFLLETVRRTRQMQEAGLCTRMPMKILWPLPPCHCVVHFFIFLKATSPLLTYAQVTVSFVCLVNPCICMQPHVLRRVMSMHIDFASKKHLNECGQRYVFRKTLHYACQTQSDVFELLLLPCIDSMLISCL